MGTKSTNFMAAGVSHTTTTRPLEPAVLAGSFSIMKCNLRSPDAHEGIDTWIPYFQSYQIIDYRPGVGALLLQRGEDGVLRSRPGQGLSGSFAAGTNLVDSEERRGRV